jgi:hypothetical protein
VYIHPHGNPHRPIREGGPIRAGRGGIKCEWFSVPIQNEND